MSRNARRSPIRRIVIGPDGSEHAAPALKWAVRMAKAREFSNHRGARHRCPRPLLAPMGLTIRDDRNWQSVIREEFEGRWCATLKTSGLHYRTVMEVGRAAPVIGAVADRENADLVVVGRRGRSGVAELLLQATGRRRLSSRLTEISTFSSKPGGR